MSSGSSEIVEWGIAARNLPGESATGDRHLVKRLPGGFLFAVVDGLGHGTEAARAAEIATVAIDKAFSEDLIEVVNRCHAALHGRRGVVMTLASFHEGEHIMRCLAVGNVQGVIAHSCLSAHAPDREFVLQRGGVVGYRLPPLRVSSVSVERDDVVILATDGIRIDFTTDRHLDGPPQALADRILASYAIESDDALVLTLRYKGLNER